MANTHLKRWAVAKLSRANRTRSLLVVLSLLLITHNSSFAQNKTSKDLLGTPGGEKNQFGSLPKSQAESPECQRAKATLRSRGKNVPTDCGLAIKLASDLAAQDYAEALKEQNRKSDELLRSAEANFARSRAENERRPIEAQRQADEAVRRAKRNAKEQNTIAAVNAGFQILNALATANTAPNSPPQETQDREVSQVNPVNRVAPRSPDSEANDGLMKILGVPTVADIQSGIDSLRESGRKATETAVKYWDEAMDKIEDSATREDDPIKFAAKSAKQASPLGGIGASIVDRVGEKIDKIFADAEKSYGRKPNESAQDMFK